MESVFRYRRALQVSAAKGGLLIRSEIIRFRARRRKNYEAYTAYTVNNLFKVVAEIWKLQPKNLCAVGLLIELKKSIDREKNQKNE